MTNEHVHVGSIVTLENMRTNSEVTYKIVGSKESKPSEGRISDESPVGMALLGHSAGDVVMVETPVGELGLKILSITR
jgi:transcription elongation factor GreA